MVLYICCLSNYGAALFAAFFYFTGNPLFCKGFCEKVLSFFFGKLAECPSGRLAGIRQVGGWESVR